MKTSATSSTVEDRTGQGAVQFLLIVCMLVLGAPPVYAADGALIVLCKGSLTTSAQLFVNPDALDVPARGEAVDIKAFFGLGAEVKYRIPETSVAVGISADYIRARTTTALTAYPRKSIPVEDGYTVIPVEVTGYFIIPVGGETFGVYMGGGAGVYFGKRTYRVGNTVATSGETSPGFGIHVLGGISYRFLGPLEAVFEMKFRELQFDAENSFATSPIRYEGTVVNVPVQPFKSRTQTDGIVFQLGLAYTF